MRVAVIGAGPSGLVTLKYLITSHLFLDTEPIEAVLFETEDSIGGTFAHRTYEDAELVSSKQLTTFSDFRPSPNEPDFLSTDRYVRYLHHYCRHFKLWNHIKLSTTVIRIEPKKNGGHLITYQKKGSSKTENYECDAVAVCSGLHVTPNIPRLKGAEKVPVVMHSSEFKKKEQFGVDKTILILESGETAMDIGYLAMQCPTKRVVMCHRDVHPTLRNHMLLWYYYDLFIKSTLWLVAGSKYSLGQLIGGISDDLFFNKSNLATPYISSPYLPTNSLLHRIRSSCIQVPLPQPSKSIDLAPWPSNIDSSTGILHFLPSTRPELKRLDSLPPIIPDILIYVTGYTQSFPFLPALTYSSTRIRSIFSPGDPTIAFIGFIRPPFGAIPPLSELQAQLWVLHLRSPSKLNPLNPEDEAHYKLLHPPNSRIQYGVEHESYAYQLALDMDSAPSFTEIIRLGWKSKVKGAWYKLPLVWALGANFNVKFRLRGPWKTREKEQAETIMVEELWETIERRGGFFGVVLLSLVPMEVFGGISFGLWLLESLMGLFRRVLGGPVVNGKGKRL
ncbi:hypothetical protein QBC38DRAFT_512162 [Podospora fimiseda]|uniref:Monooxygenase n=1 Tax=Podospora fimiseda TaxID=252190 RepID=A0AAN7BHV6_9PEZI|nr:hypothetical protein QBC38DRAFT_512162 [Podospora fimiseda]